MERDPVATLPLDHITTFEEMTCLLRTRGFELSGLNFYTNGRINVWVNEGGEYTFDVMDS